MLTTEEKREWILKNCCDPSKDYIDLSWLDFSGYEIDLSHMKAKRIKQKNQQAQVIYQSDHTADIILQDGHFADIIYQGDNKLGVSISRNRHKYSEVLQSAIKAEVVEDMNEKEEN